MSSSNINQSQPIEEYLKRADTIMDKRFLYFAFNVLGKNAEIQLENGAKAKGKFHSTSIDNGAVVIKNLTQGESGKLSVPTQVLDVKDFVYILVSDVEEPPLLKPKKDVFKTDTEISKNKINDQRAFVKWDAGGDDLLGSGAGLSLEESAHEKGKWNQFELNEKRFGLRSHYEENMYTTHLDMKNVSASLLEKATRLEAEILNNAADLDNRHVREERGLQELKEDDEDEEFAYSSVIRTNSKTEKKADEERKPKFTNSKKQAATTQKTETLAPPENKKETVGKPLEVSTTARDFIPTGTPTTLSANKKPENEKTPKVSSEVGGIQQQSLSRQTSNVSEDPLRKKPSLNVTSGTFDLENKKDENKVAPARQASIESEPDKKANTLTPAEFHSTLSAKFKLKLTEKDVKRSCVSFFDYAIPNWQKKPILNDKSSDPSLVNPNWKIAKSTALRTPATPKAITPTSQPTTNASTPKPLSKPNTNAQPFNAPAGMPTNNFGGGMMMGQMGQPFMGPGFPQPYMNTGMSFMPPVQKFTPGFPMPQPNMPMYGAMPGYVDPNQPNFNMGMNYHPPHGGRQGGPQINRNYNKNKQ